MQVNGLAQYEYTTGIPMRCGPQLRMGCGDMWLAQLNNWYGQQVQAINYWYVQINGQCNNQAVANPIPDGNPGSGAIGAPQINTQKIETLQVDTEDKTVQISIPSNPAGFR
jgi:hypothetical protein